MVNIRLAPLLLVLAFLSFPPIILSLNPKTIRIPRVIFKGFEKLYSEARDILGWSSPPMAPPPAMSPKASPPAMAPTAPPPIRTSELLASPPTESPKASPPSDNTEADEPIGFYVIFSVGNSSTTWIAARMSISSEITSLENYQPSYSSSYQCCTENLTCSTENCNGDYYLRADTFNFDVGYLNNVPYLYKTGDKTLNTTGFLSFSRSRYSLPSIAQQEVFSYFFSDFLDCNVTIGPTVNYTASLQSTKIITYPNYPDYYYYLSLTQISVGKKKFKFDPTTNSSIVILDTVILPTLLETSVYAKVKSELIKLGNSFNDPDTGLEVCYNSTTNWPDLTLFFPSDSPSSVPAEMVLTNYSYAVKVQSGAECAAIYECEGGSVIGILAQLSREMIFNLSKPGPRLYFSQYPAGEHPRLSAAAVPTKAALSGILIWSLCVLLYLCIAV